ncbi:hypothetical protein ACEWFX_09860 [Bifidobacterium longum subsp. suis]|uniref:hypothetical protein n=1 Tax=Bifidobacterium longum TaxID=216816 RepID=UPI003CFDD5F6
MGEYAETLDLNKLEEPAYVWIGKELPAFLRDDDDDAIPMIVALDRFRDFPPSFSDVIRYMATPREESELKNWLRNQQAPDDFIPWLVQEKAILRIMPKERLSDSFAGIHLEPYGRRLPEQGQEMIPQPTLSNVMMSSNPEQADKELSQIMTNVLFSSPWQDLPTVIRQVASSLHIDESKVSDMTMASLPELLANDYAFLLLME